MGVSFFARLFGMALGRAPQPAQTPFAAGVAAFDRQRFDEALAHFATALVSATTANGAALVQNKLALIYLRRGDRDAAVAAFCAALEADARCVPVIVNIGNVLLEDGILDDAVAHYEAALRIDDGYPSAYFNLGIAFKRLGRRADAVRAFRRANRLEAGLRGPKRGRILHS